LTNLAGMNMRFFLLMTLAALVYGANIWGTSVYILDEAKNASCALEMLQRNDLVIPTFNNELRTDKPPLHYFFMMLAYHLFDVSSFSARIFSVLAGVILIAFLYRKVARWTDERAAFYTCFMLIASLHMAVQFHLAVPDPYLLLWMTVSLISLYESLQQQPRAVYLLYVSAALGFLTKGLITVVFPALAGILYILIRKYPLQEAWRSLKPLTGLLIFSAIALPWYIAVGIATEGAWLRGFFLQHHLHRYTATMEGHRGFFLAPLIFLLMALFPFSVFSTASFRTAWARRKTGDLLFFAGVVVAVVVVFFSFSRTLLPGYVGPAIPFFAIMVGHFLVQGHLPGKVSLRVMSSIALLIALAFPVAGYLLLREQYSGQAAIYLNAPLFVIPAAVMLGIYYFRKQQMQRAMITWGAGLLILSQIFFYVIHPALDNRNPVVDSRPVREKYREYQPATYGLFNPAFVFEYRKPLPELSLSLYDSVPVMIITRSAYENEIAAKYRVEPIYRKKDLFESSETLILVSSGVR
jgi:4-amino-4-deoxy-L-arabinose transferase-like glycosyltransferase